MLGEFRGRTKADAQGPILYSEMARTAAHKLGTDWRFQVAFLLVGVAIAVPVGLVTDKLSAGSMTVSVFAILLGLAKYRQERSRQSLASTGHEKSDSN